LLVIDPTCCHPEKRGNEGSAIERSASRSFVSLRMTRAPLPTSNQ
jgi:hypothetical protein